MMKDRAMWPLEIKYKRSEKNLYIRFDTGEEYTLTAELLRLESPSAEMKGHGGDEAQAAQIRKNDMHKNRDKKDVGIGAIEPVGNYAVRLIFDDGHATGIYSWEYLYQLAQDYHPHKTDGGNINAATPTSTPTSAPAPAHSCGCGRGSSGSCQS